MRPIDHYRDAKKVGFGTIKSLLVMLPDLFVLFRKIVPIEPIKRWCMENHNTQMAVDRMAAINGALGDAWGFHWEQDTATHDFDYDFSYLIPKDAVMMYSGGLDSFIQWRLLGKPKCVYFDIGHKASHSEFIRICKATEDLGLDLTRITDLNLEKFEMDNAYIPYRNLFFIMLASLRSPNVVIAQISEWAPDKNSGFYRKTEHLLNGIRKGKFQGLNMGEVSIYSPFSGWTKTELVREYISRWPAEDLERYSWSCYSNGLIPCGKCTACVSRHIAMVNNGIEEKTADPVDISLLTKKLSIKDFKVQNIPMYLKRYDEMKKYKKLTGYDQKRANG